MRRHALSLAVAAALAGSLPPASAGAFCGFYVSGADASLYNNATQVVLMRDGVRTVLSMANNYGVKIEAQFSVGEYDVVILSAARSPPER